MNVPTMLSFILSVIFVISKVGANDSGFENPEIRLTTFNANKNYTVMKDKPLKIIIENSFARFVWCSDSYANSHGQIRKFVPDTEFQNNIVSILHVSKVTAEMSTRWKCTVLQLYADAGSTTPIYWYKSEKYTAKEFNFNLNVKGAKAVSLSANTRSLTYVTTDLSVSHDGEASYTYVDGEDLQISCEKAGIDKEKIYSTLRLEYYNAAGILLFQTKPRDKKPHVFGSVLKSSNDNDYLDCIRSTQNPVREYRYRTKFLMTNENFDGADQHAIILSVNGQNLTSISKEQSYDDYIFRYIHSGLLNVLCQKMGNERGSLYFYTNGTRMTNRRIFLSPSGAISLNVTTVNLNNTTLTCGINNTEVPKPNARILFLRDELASNIRLRGLPSSNVMYQYTNGDSQWTIEYQYSMNETLNVTCEGYAGFTEDSGGNRRNYFQWTFQGRSYDSRERHWPNYTSNKWSETPFTKILEAFHNRAILQCIYFTNGQQYPNNNHSVELILHLKRGPSSDSSTLGEADTLGAHNDILTYGLSAFGVSALIILIILCLKFKRRCCMAKPRELPMPPAPTCNQDNVFYFNRLSVFMPERERELLNHYEMVE